VTSERVTCTIRDGVADVRLNRPDKLNALDLEMFAALGATGDRLQAERDVRVVVLSGEGRAFCAGIDLALLVGGGAAEVGLGGGDPVPDLLSGRGAGRIANQAQHAAWVWHELEMPVIAALHGVVFGGGIQIALAADLRLATPDSRLSVMEVRWGIVPDMSGTYTLARTVGLDVAKELTWTGRQVSGEEALRLGLVTRLSDEPRATALALAAELAGRNPDALRLGKALLDRSLDASPGEQLLAEEAAARSLIGTANQREAVAASLENRPPRYTPRAQ
jgi:enoyl-CoA hydratase/carnithine racemase